MKYFKLFNYQNNAVDDLVNSSSLLIEDNNKNNQYILLEAITGAGKTVISTSYIEKIVSKYDDIAFIWLSIGKGNLEEQSYNRLKRDLPNDITVINKDEILTKDKLCHRDVLVLNWESLNNKDKDTGEFTNILMRSGEKRNLIQILENTRSHDTKIILFIDESHSMSKSETSKEIVELINPLFTIEITATPDKKQLGEDLINKKAIHIQVNPKDVIEEGVIKKSILINNSLAFSEESSDIEILLENALDMHSRLHDKYNYRVNPLILIQIPNKKLGEEVKETVLNYLSNRIDFDIDTELAIWLSDSKDKVNLKNIDYLNSPVKCLIFKQSVATGWDCPRAQILVKLRETKSETFDLQVIGRILRMPELSRRKHYEEDILNHAYIYTNIDSFKTEVGLYSENILPQKTEVREEFKNDLITLSSSKVKRTYSKFNSAKFTKKFDNNINLNYKIEELYDISDIFKEYVSSEVDSRDVLLLNEDISKNKKSSINMLSVSGIEKEYNDFIDGIDNKNRNHIKNAIRAVFYSKLREENIINIQKSVLNNRDIFKNVIVETLGELKIETECEVEPYKYRPTEDMYYSKDITLYGQYNKSLYYLVPETKHKTEKLFENKVDNDPRVKYWIRNKDKGSNAFSITYEYERKLHSFYPDYIVKFNDGTLGIYEVKSTSDRDSETTTKDKENSLLRYALNNDNTAIKDVQIVKVDSSKESFVTETLGNLK